MNDPMASAKLSVVHALAESVTQKAISNQMKLDSLLSKECERWTSDLTNWLPLLFGVKNCVWTVLKFSKHCALNSGGHRLKY